MKLSVVIPARDEAGSIGDTVSPLLDTLRAASIPSEIIVVDDGSRDETAERVRQLALRNPEVRLVRNEGRHGFGMAVRAGLDEMTGDAVAIMMADASDSPDDLVRYYRKLEEGWDCVFGSRFMDGGRVQDYPSIKLIINRAGQLVHQGALRPAAERHHQRLQGVPARGDRGHPAADLAAFQLDRRDASQGDRARILLCRGSDHLDESAGGSFQAEDCRRWAAATSSS